MRSLLAALLLALTAAAHADTRTFERIEWTRTWDQVLPDDDRAQWEEIDLPHNWYTTWPAINKVWYRARFALEDEPTRLQSLYFPKLVLSEFAVFVNGQPVWRLSDYRAYGSALTTLQIPIPQGLLRPGTNTIHFSASGYPQWHQGLSRFRLGDYRVLAESASREGFLQSQMLYVSAAGFGVVGLVCLWLWQRSGRDPVLFWYGISGLALLVATVLWYQTLWREDLRAARLALTFLRYNGYLVPILILHLRIANRRNFWLEGALWATLAAALVWISMPGAWQPVLWRFGSLAYASLLALAALLLLSSQRLRTNPAVLLLVVADVVAALMTYHDWASRLGWIAFDRPYYVFRVAPFLMLAAGAVILRHLMSGVDALRESNVDLERRVAEKMLQVEAGQEELRRAQRESALAEERRRIMADMHDGLGARLVALLSVAQSGKARHGEISEGLAAALDELRLTIDSVQPVEGDVGVVLGNVRHRMRSVFERAGVQLVWNVSELPRLDSLTPERILAIQRIFLEVFSNAIRHSGARTVLVFTTRVPGAVRIVIEDDGSGFDPQGTHAGTGLHNLQLRAAQAGGVLQLESKEGKGTRVTLSLPLGDGTEPAPLPRMGEKDDFSPIRGISAGRAEA